MLPAIGALTVTLRDCAVVSASTPICLSRASVRRSSASALA